ncbi:MAG: phosphotransferase [Xanthobacteraceae bacterium]
MSGQAEARVRALPIWHGAVEPRPLGGGISNLNFLVDDGGRRCVVRIGDDVPVHGVLRAHEIAASRAAHAAGISPAVLYAEPGILVIEHIEARTYAAPDVRADLERVIDLVARAHREVPRHLRGPAAAFWVFHVLRDYTHTLRDAGFRLAAELPRYGVLAARLEAAVGAVELVYGHNDLLAANLLDDGSRLWLIDWEYSGFNSPLFDLGGLASNNGLDAAACETMLAIYFDRPVTDELRRRFQAMRAASLLREAMWSMVSELHTAIDFDYAAYTAENLARFEAAYSAFDDMERS